MWFEYALAAVASLSFAIGLYLVEAMAVGAWWGSYMLRWHISRDDIPRKISYDFGRSPQAVALSFGLTFACVMILFVRLS